MDDTKELSPISTAPPPSEQTPTLDAKGQSRRNFLAAGVGAIAGVVGSLLGVKAEQKVAGGEPHPAVQATTDNIKTAGNAIVSVPENAAKTVYGAAGEALNAVKQNPDPLTQAQEQQQAGTNSIPADARRDATDRMGLTTPQPTDKPQGQ